MRRCRRRSRARSRRARRCRSRPSANRRSCSARSSRSLRRSGSVCVMRTSRAAPASGAVQMVTATRSECSHPRGAGSRPQLPSALPRFPIRRSTATPSASWRAARARWPDRAHRRARRSSRGRARSAQLGEPCAVLHAITPCKPARGGIGQSAATRASPQDGGRLTNRERQAASMMLAWFSESETILVRTAERSSTQVRHVPAAEHERGRMVVKRTTRPRLSCARVPVDRREPAAAVPYSRRPLRPRSRARRRPDPGSSSSRASGSRDRRRASAAPAAPRHVEVAGAGLARAADRARRRPPHRAEKFGN